MNYKKILVRAAVLACFILSAGVSLSTAQNFEGVIHYQLPSDDPGGVQQMQYMMKDGKVRMQFAQGASSGALLFFPKQSKMIVLMDQMHAYMEMGDLSKLKSDDSGDDKWKNTSVDKTGQTKTIAGYKCEIWKVHNREGDKLTMCMAKGLGTFMSPANPMSRKSAPAWAKEIIKKGYTPLEVIETENGRPTTQMRATKIEEKSLDASLFKIPDGYKDMSTMMKQMMKANNKQHQK